MATWFGTARSNYFKVKDTDAFKIWAEENDMDVVVKKEDGVETVAVFAVTDTGGWPSEYTDPDTGDDTEINLLDRISSHMTDDTVCVMMESGAEKQRYITGNALAFTSKAEPVVVNLNDIYQKAEDAFGIKPTMAEY